MQTIQAVMRQIMQQPNMKQAYERAVMLVEQDQAIQQFLEQHQAMLTAELIRNSLSKLNEFRLERQALARGEQGSNPGFYPALFLNQGYIDVTYVPTAEYQQREQQQKLARLLDNRMMSADVRQAQLNQYELNTVQRQALMFEVTEFLARYQQSPQQAQGLYITGPYGVGKTYLLGALANYLVTQLQVSVSLIHYPTLAVEMREAISKGTTQTLLNELKQVDVLMLDDIGAENDPSGWVRDDVLAILLEYRMKENLPTFFTSNFNLNELEVILADSNSGSQVVRAKRIMERVRYLAKEMNLAGENRRRLQRQE